MGLGTAVAYLTLDATGFARGIDVAMVDAQRLNTGFQNISTAATRVGDTMVGVGKILTAGITAPVIGFGAASIKSGAEFDKSMSDVKAVSINTKTDMDALAVAAKDLGVSYKAGSTDAETAFNALRATAIKMGNDTKFTAKESADALYYMGLAGWSADQMIAGIPGVLSLASAGNTELARTSDIVTDAITGFGHSADETVSVIRGGFNTEIPIATRLADIMASTMANSNTDIDMLGDSFKYVTPIAGSFGYSMEDVSLSLGLMANAGIKSTQAGTTLRQGLKRLADQTSSAQPILEKYGVSMYDVNGNIRPLRDSLSDLRGVFGNLDIEVTKADGTLKTTEEIMDEYGKKLPINDQEKLTDAVTAFGTTALPGMLALMGASQDSFDSLADAIDNSSAAFVLHNGEVMTYADAIKKYGEEIVTTSDAFDVLGSAEGMSLIQLDNLQGDWTLFTSALGTTKQIISDMANGPLRELVQKLTDLVRKFNEMDPEQQKHIVKLALMAAAIGPLLIGFGKLVIGLSNFKSAMQGLSGTFTSVGSLLGLLVTKVINVKEGFALAQAGFPSLGKQASLLGSKLGTVSTAFASVSSAAGGGFVGAIKGAVAALGMLVTPVGAVVAAIGVLVGAFAYLMTTNEEFRDAVVSKFKGLWDTLKGYFQEIVDAVNSLGFNFEDIVDLIKGAWDGLCNFLAPVLQGIVTIITNAISAIVQTVTGVIQIISGVIGTIKGIFTGDGEQIKKSLDILLKGLINIVEGFVKLFLAPFTGMVETINNIFGTNLPSSFNELKIAIGNLVTVIGDKVTAIIGWFKQIPDKIVELFGSIGDFFADIASTVSDFVTDIGDAVSGWVQSVTTWFNELLGNILNFLSQIITVIDTFVSNLAKKATEIGTKFIQVVIKFFTELSNKIKTIIAQVLTNVTTWVTNMVNKAKDLGTKFVQNIVTFFTQLPGKIQSFIQSALTKVTSWVTNMVAKAKELGTKFISNIVSFYSQLPGKVWGFLATTISKVALFVSDMIAKAKEVGTQFLSNIINFLSQLPGKVRSFLVTTISNVTSFVSDMVQKAIQVGTQFLSNVISSLSQLPGNVWSIFTQAIEKAAQFVTQMGQKGMQAAKDLGSKFISAAAGLPSKVMSIGKNIVEGVWKGISNAASWFQDKVKSFFNGIVDGVKGALGIHSPSTVFEKQVGLNIVLGLAKGITENSSKATNATNSMMNGILDATGSAYDKAYKQATKQLTKLNKQIEKLQDKISKTTNKKQKERLKKQLANLKEERKQQKQAIEDLQSDYLSYCETQLSQQQKLYNMSEKQIIEYWENVRSHLDEGTEAYEEATQKIIDAQIDMYANIVSNAEEALNKMQNEREVSLAEQVQYWENVRSQCLIGSAAYEEATDRINEALKGLTDGADEAFTTLQEGMAAVTESVKTKVNEIVESYNDAVSSTKDTLMGLAGLFDQFTIDEAQTGTDLMSSLQSQVDGLEQWNAVIDSMFTRGLPDDLIEELQSMGPKAMGSIVNLLNMTDEELSEYIALWERKNAEAQSAALKMVDKTPYVQQIQEVIDEAGEEVEALVLEYNAAMEELGYTSSTTAAEMAANFSDGFTFAIREDLSNTDFGFIGDIFKEERYSGLGTTIAKPLNEALINSLQEAVETAAATAAETATEVTPEVTEAIQSAVSEDNIDVSGYTNVGMNIVEYIITGVKNKSSQLNSQMKTTGKNSQVAFIDAIKAKEADVNREGQEVGKQLDNGMAQGINDYVGNVITAAVAAVQAAIAAARAAAAISSPSKVMANQVGKWLPLGMAKGFVDYTPQATDEMQDAIDDGINSLQGGNIELFPDVKSVSEEVREAFKDVSNWFTDVSKSVSDMTDTMKENIQDVVDITDGMLYNIYDGGNDNLNNLISGKNTTSTSLNDIQQTTAAGTNSNQTTNTFIFNSPKAIDEVQASRLIRQTSRNLAEGFG